MGRQVEVKGQPVRAPAGKLYEVTVKGQEPGQVPTYQKSINPNDEGLLARLIDIVAGRR